VDEIGDAALEHEAFNEPRSHLNDPPYTPLRPLHVSVPVCPSACIIAQLPRPRSADGRRRTTDNERLGRLATDRQTDERSFAKTIFVVRSFVVWFRSKTLALYWGSFEYMLLKRSIRHYSPQRHEFTAVLC